MSRLVLAAALAAAMLTVAACGGAPATAGDPDPDTPDSATDPSSGMCAPDMPDCVDVVIDGEGDQFDSEAARAEARDLLGKAEDELGEHVRVGRRDGEHMALTEDYVLGRDTVELESDGQGVYRVVAVTVELPDGPETLTD